jgi:hypothetical protein
LKCLGGELDGLALIEPFCLRVVKLRHLPPPDAADGDLPSTAMRCRLYGRSELLRGFEKNF